MQKKLILHIGHYKTGTTALQVFFAQNRKFLAQNGISYPDILEHNGKHSVLAFSILAGAGLTDRLMHGFTTDVKAQDIWAELLKYIDESKNPTTLVSSEEFMRVGQFPAAIEILNEILSNRPEWLDVEVVVYLRDPKAHMKSWYNQLIKMGIAVPNLEEATRGTIEEIHYDYRHALKPWVDILGKENVTIRPYGNNRDDPAALHRDFMKTLGVELPEGLVRVKTDPNPRLDDRVTELLRLMQNMGYPRASKKAIRAQAVSYLKAQDAKRGDESKTLDDVQTQARDGLEWLSEQADGALPIADFVERLPEGVSEDTAASNMLLGFVFSEFIQLRQRVQNSGMADMRKRLEALEVKVREMDSQK
jgi:hypothetical protein